MCIAYTHKTTLEAPQANAGFKLEFLLRQRLRGLPLTFISPPVEHVYHSLDRFDRWADAGQR